MRKDSTPQVETREISESDLDNISGGLSVSGGVSGGVAVEGVNNLLSTVTYALPAVPVGEVVGLAGGATSALSGVTGLAGI
jgi:hypothetical protein